MFKPPKEMILSKKGAWVKCKFCGARIKEYKELGMLGCWDHGRLCNDHKRCENGDQRLTAHCKRVDHMLKYQGWVVLSKMQMNLLFNSWGRKKKNLLFVKEATVIPSDPQLGLYPVLRDDSLNIKKLKKQFEMYKNYERNEVLKEDNNSKKKKQVF